MLGIGRRDAGIEGPAGRESGGRAHPVKARGMSRSPPFACSVDRMPAHRGHPLAGRARRPAAPGHSLNKAGRCKMYSDLPSVGAPP